MEPLGGIFSFGARKSEPPDFWAELGLGVPRGGRCRGDFHGFLLGAPSPSSGVNLKKTAPLGSRRIAHRKLLRVSASLRDKWAVRVGVCVPFAPLATLALNGSKDLVAALLPCGHLWFMPSQMSQMDADGTAGGHILVRRQEI
jgi:hypothetical protein